MGFITIQSWVMQHQVHCCVAVNVVIAEHIEVVVARSRATQRSDY
jgi:hypothetical protein